MPILIWRSSSTRRQRGAMLRRPIPACDGAGPQQRTPAQLLHHDVPALFSLGLQVTYVLGEGTYRLHERGWPAWLAAILPNWAPGPVGVLYLLPAVSIFTAGIALLWTDRSISRPPTAYVPTPLVCWLAAIGSIALWLQLFWRARWQLCDVSWLLLMCFAAMPMLPFADRPFRRFRRWRSGRCARCGFDRARQSLACDACGSSYGTQNPARQLQVRSLVTTSSLVSSLIVAIPVIAYHLCRAACGVRPIDLLDASRRVTPGSTASRFIGPGLFMAEWVPTVACAVAVFSIIVLGTAIRRKDGHAGPLTAIAVGLSILSGFVAYDTGLLIRGL